MSSVRIMKEALVQNVRMIIEESSVFNQKFFDILIGEILIVLIAFSEPETKAFKNLVVGMGDMVKIAVNFQA